MCTDWPKTTESGPGKVDQLEDAVRKPPVRGPSGRASRCVLTFVPSTTTISPGSTSRTFGGLEHVQRARLRGDEHLAVTGPHDERPKPVRVPHRVELAFVHHEEAVCALDPAQAFQERVPEGGLPRAGDHVEEQLRVAGALEDRAFGDQVCLQLLGVGDVPVVRQGDLSLAARHHDGLRVLQLVGAMGGIADVPDAQGGGVVFRKVVGEGVGHHAHAAV